MARSRLDRLFTGASSIDIVLYIREHPGCRKSDIYSDVTRNVHTLDKLHEFRDCGIIDMDESGNRALMRLSEMGEDVAEALLEIDRLIGDGSRDDPDIT